MKTHRHGFPRGMPIIKLNFGCLTPINPHHSGGSPHAVDEDGGKEVDDKMWHRQGSVNGT